MVNTANMANIANIPVATGETRIRRENRWKIRTDNNSLVRPN